jgi:recombination protein RecA
VPEASVKSTITFKLAADVQNRIGKSVALIDMEHSFDPIWASECGMDVDKMYLLRPPTAELAVNCVEAMLYADDVGLVILDSIGAMTTSNEIESDAEKQAVGGASALVSKMCRKAVVAMSKQHTAGNRVSLLCINQIRHKIGVMYGDPEYMPGGNLLKFTSSMTIRLYGKDRVVKEVNPQLPAFKTTTAVVKKAKVPILSKNFEYELCLIPHKNLGVGDAPSWNTVSNLLKLHGLLVKDGPHYSLVGSACDPTGVMQSKFKTMGAMQDLYETDPLFLHSLQQAVIDKEMSKEQADGQPVYEEGPE